MKTRIVALMSCITRRWLSLVAENKWKKKQKKVMSRIVFKRCRKVKPPEIIPYSFCGESVKENAIVAFPLSLTEMLFGRSRSLWVLLLSDFDEKTISGWTTFVVVSLTRDAVKWTIENGRKREALGGEREGERERFTKH